MKIVVENESTAGKRSTCMGYDFVRIIFADYNKSIQEDLRYFGNSWQEFHQIFACVSYKVSELEVYYFIPCEAKLRGKGDFGGTIKLQYRRMKEKLPRLPMMVFLSNKERLAPAIIKDMNCVQVHNFDFTAEERDAYRKCNEETQQTSRNLSINRTPRQWAINACDLIVSNIQSGIQNTEIIADTGAGKTHLVQLILDNLPRTILAALIGTPYRQLNEQTKLSLSSKQGVQCLDTDTRIPVSVYESAEFKSRLVRCFEDRFFEPMKIRNLDLQHTIACFKTIKQLTQLISTYSEYGGILIILDEHFKYCFDDEFAKLQQVPNLFFVYMSATPPVRIPNKKAHEIMSTIHKDAFMFTKQDCVDAGYSLPIDFYIIQSPQMNFYERVAHELCMNSSHVVACFTPSTEEAKEACAFFEQVCNTRNVNCKFYCIHVKGKDDKQTSRCNAIQSVKRDMNEYDLVFYVFVQIGRFCLNIPQIDTVVIACPLEDSQILCEDLLKQISERSGRPDAGKTRGKVFMHKNKLDALSKYKYKHDPTLKFTNIYSAPIEIQENNVLGYVLREPCQECDKQIRKLHDDFCREYISGQGQDVFEIKCNALFDQYLNTSPSEEAMCTILYNTIKHDIKVKNI